MTHSGKWHKRNIKALDDADIMEAAAVLLEQGADMGIHKCERRGAYLISRKKAELVPGFKVAAVDTTAGRRLIQRRVCGIAGQMVKI